MDEFREAQAGLKGPGTSGWWEHVLPELTVEQRASLEAAAADRTISHRAICVVLGRWGFELTPAQVGHWRRNYVH